MQLNDFDKGTLYNAKVIKNAVISEPDDIEVRQLVVRVAQDSSDMTVAVGQSIGVVVPGVPEIDHPDHFRFYSIAHLDRANNQQELDITLCVKRHFHIDPATGLSREGVASNYLCSRDIDDTLNFNGPFDPPFPVPEDKSADLILIGMGTGIAPFRAFMRRIYNDVSDWKGRVRLFHGAESGLEQIYTNQADDDFSQYYDEPTFTAIEALSPRGHWDNTGANMELERAIEERALEVLSILKRGNGYIYVAGFKDIENTLNAVFSRLMGDEKYWQLLKQELEAQQRWVALTY